MLGTHMSDQHLRIRGGKPLHGRVEVPGAKNAALKMIAACLLTDESCVLENVPQISDVARMVGIIRALGVEVEEDAAQHQLTICAASVDPTKLPEEDVRSLRASIVLLGPLLVRCGTVRMPHPGGDHIGVRPITAHLKALTQLGVEIESDRSFIHANVPTSGLRPANVVLPEFSVTATENVLLAAAGIPGTTTIEIAAVEPHVQDLGAFLRSMGAGVRIEDSHTFIIEGTRHLGGATHRIVSDVIDAFTFLAAGLVTRGQITVGNVNPKQLTLPLAKLEEMGAPIAVHEDSIETLVAPGTLKATSIQAMPYPGVPSDLQPLFALIATQAEGTTLIHDPLYENRFRYLEELIRMGANASMLDPHRAVIRGPTPLVGIPISSFDIRPGAILVLAGLMAQGTTIIEGIAHIDRGYEDMDSRLRSLGADVERIS